MWRNSITDDDAVYVPRAERVSFDMQVRYRSEAQRGVVLLKNLNCGGARIEGLGGLAINQTVTLWLPSLKPKMAQVAWTLGHAVGLEFQRPLHPDIFEELVLHHASRRPRTEADRQLGAEYALAMAAQGFGQAMAAAMPSF